MSQQYSTFQLTIFNEPYEGLDTKTDGLDDRQL
jgi:hypothetical protein